MSPSDRRAIPYQISDAVEHWARSRGRHASIGWNPVLGCAVIDITLKGDDPRLKAYQEGRLKHEPKESVILHYQKTDYQGNTSGPFIALNLEELGVTGIIEMLEKGDVWSGRGEFSSLHEAVQKVAQHNETHREKMKQDIRDAAMDRAKDMRRQILDLPLVSVPANIGDSNG